MLAAAELHWRQLLHVQQACSSILGAVLSQNRSASTWRSPVYTTQIGDDVKASSSALCGVAGAKALKESCPNSSSSSCATSLRKPAVALGNCFHNQQRHYAGTAIHESVRQVYSGQQCISSGGSWHTSTWLGSSRCSCKQIEKNTRNKYSGRELSFQAPISRCSSTLSCPAADTRPFSTSSSTSSVLSGDSSSSSSPTWVDKHLPHSIRPYAHLMRLDKPIGSWLLAWPGLWTIALAAEPGHLPDPWLTSLFAVGAVLMRGAGCTVNDLWDQDIDKKVQRTRSRPLAAGTVSQNAALAFLAAQLLLSFGILLQLNTYTQVLGWCSLALVGTYPLMKRVTWWPQAFLGLCMNYGVLMGYAAAHGSCDWAVVLPMYAAGINWTLVYDTIYAHQDKKDDAQIGVKSTALLLGDRTKTWATGFAVLQLLGLVAAGNAAGMGMPYYAAVATGAGHQAWQIGRVDLNDGADCMAKFVSNKWYGAILYAGIVADRLLATAVC